MTSLELDEEVTDISLSPNISSAAVKTSLNEVESSTSTTTKNTIPNTMTNDTNEASSTILNNTPTQKEQEDEGTQGGGEEDLNVHELLDELEEPTETEMAVKQLRESTRNLTSVLKSVGSDIDHRLNLTESARGIDANLGLTRTVSNTTSSIGTLWSQLQITEKASSLVNNDVVTNASESVKGTLEHTGVTSMWEKETQRIKNLDQEHKISTTAVGTLSSGMNWLTGQLESRTGYGAGAGTADEGGNKD